MAAIFAGISTSRAHFRRYFALGCGCNRDYVPSYCTFSRCIRIGNSAARLMSNHQINSICFWVIVAIAFADLVVYVLREYKVIAEGFRAAKRFMVRSRSKIPTFPKEARDFIYWIVIFASIPILVEVSSLANAQVKVTFVAFAPDLLFIAITACMTACYDLYKAKQLHNSPLPALFVIAIFSAGVLGLSDHGMALSEKYTQRIDSHIEASLKQCAKLAVDGAAHEQSANLLLTELEHDVAERDYVTSNSQLITVWTSIVLIASLFVSILAECQIATNKTKQPSNSRKSTRKPTT